jgi:hypothetical protein
MIQPVDSTLDDTSQRLALIADLSHAEDHHLAEADDWNAASRHVALSPSPS